MTKFSKVHRILFLSAKIFVILFIAMPLSVSAQDEDEGTDPIAQINVSLRRKEYLKAEHQCRQLLYKQPADLEIKHLLSHALIFQQRYNEADSLLRKVLETDTNNSGTYWYMGLSTERQGKDSIAVLRFKKYIAKTPNPLNINVSAWLHAASGYRRMMHKQGVNRMQFDEMLYLYNHYLEQMPTDLYADDIREFLSRAKSRQPVPGKKLIWDEAVE